MSIKTVLTSVVAAAVVSFGVLHFAGSPQTAQVQQKESVYDRVMRTGEIRCGYITWPPLVIQDPNTNEISGIVPEIMQAIAKAADLKLVWQEELNFSTYLNDLNAGRYDVECSGGWPNAQRAKHVAYTDAFAAQPIYAYVRADDTRFDQSLDAANSENVSIAIVDGETSSIVKSRRFPDAKMVEIPGVVGSPDHMLLQVSSGKADMTFVDVASANRYMQANPNEIKPLVFQPVHLIELSISMGMHETALLNFLNETLDELQNSGAIDAIIKKYDTVEGTFIPVTSSFKY